MLTTVRSLFSKYGNRIKHIGSTSAYISKGKVYHVTDIIVCTFSLAVQKCTVLQKQMLVGVKPHLANKFKHVTLHTGSS